MADKSGERFNSAFSACQHVDMHLSTINMTIIRQRRRDLLLKPQCEQVPGDKQEEAGPPQIYHRAKTVNERPQAVARQHYPYHSRKWSHAEH